MSLQLWTTLLALNFLQKGVVWSLSLTQVRIENHAMMGNFSVLECHYDLQGETLYSVKWYKDGQEFFRFLPRDKHPVQVFPMEGVDVDIPASNATQVVLRSLLLTSTGRYRCEVSAEAPSFQTVSDHGDLLVVALPKEGPKIRGGRPRYQMGDTVRVNCTSGRSKPPVHLIWFINGEQADRSFLRGPQFATAEDGLDVTSLGLEFKVESRHFLKGDLKLKCLATISTIYWNSNEESVEGEKPQRSPAMEVKETTNRSRADRVQGQRPGPVTIGDGSHTTPHWLLLLSTLTLTLTLVGR
ncbi:uncharacterized protein LOC128987838 [Macrosteles quadrilineatus]|uniref:uncharacterized protein LOC128987838 n=1 Tax=Macrosteles quadrilineatus TaxID=74068 RepID=UPI0023E13E97|nr:uncharacterized protein LOC128987838 [Macrosteles quadrilineatus]